MIRNENGLLTGYVYVDVAGRDIGSYVDGGRAAWCASRSSCRRATRCSWSGQYEAMERVRERLQRTSCR